MKIILFSIFILGQLAMLPVQAGVVEGFLLRKGNEFFIENKFRVIPIAIEDNDVARDLSRLSSGDFISAMATYDPKSQKMRVKSVNFVSLQRLLGTWRTRSWEIFNFFDYQSVEVSKPVPKGAPNLTTGPYGQYYYRLAPAKGQKWSMFLVANSGVNLGTIEFTQRGLKMTIFEFIDNPDGSVTEKEVVYKLQQVPHIIF